MHVTCKIKIKINSFYELTKSSLKIYMIYAIQKSEYFMYELFNTNRWRSPVNFLLILDVERVGR